MRVSDYILFQTWVFEFFFFYMAEFSVFLENTISFYSVAEGIHQ